MTKVAPRTKTSTEKGDLYAVVPCAVLNDQSLSDAAVRLFCVLDARVTTKSSQQIRQDTLAEQLGWSRSKVQRALGDLVAAGHVSVKHTARSSRISVTNSRRSKSTGSQRREPTGTTSGAASNLRQHTPSSVKSEAAAASNMTPLYRNTSLRNTSMAAQPRAERAGVPSISETKPDWVPDHSEKPTAQKHAADGPEIMPDRVLLDYLTAIWDSTGHHLDRNHLTEGVLTRIHQHGTSPKDTADLAAKMLAAKGSTVRNPAGFLVRVVLPTIADQILTEPPAPKATPTPPPLAQVTSAARCDHGAEIGRCALCRQEKPAADPSCVHGQKQATCTPCRSWEQEQRQSFLDTHPEIVTDHSCGHQERKPDGSCPRCSLEVLVTKRSLAMAANI